MRPRRQTRLVLLELEAQLVELPPGGVVGEVEDVEQHETAVDVSQEGEAETAVEVSAADQTGDVGN